MHGPKGTVLAALRAITKRARNQCLRAQIRAGRRHSSARSARRRSPLAPNEAERTKLVPFAGIGAGHPETFLGGQAKEDVTGVGPAPEKEE